MRGTHEHERMDRQLHEVSAGVRVEYALPVWSRRLGFSGRCDAVEFHPDGTIYPVEYKHGKRRRWINDDLQLAAQALCLEEMLERAVTRRAIYHQQSRRRREVIVDQALRREVEDTVEAVQGLLSKTERPPPVEDARRCGECSLREICQPDLARAEREILGLKAHLFEPRTKPCDGTPFAALYLAVQ